MPAVGINLNKSDLPPWLEAFYKELSKLASGQAVTPYLPYQGSRLQDFNTDQQAAFSLGRKTGLHTAPLAQAEGQIGKGVQDFPTLYMKYMNPYTQQVVKGIGEVGNQNFRDHILPSIESQFVGKGQAFSGHHQKMANRAGLEAQQQISRAQSDALSRGYEQGAQTFAQDQSRHLVGAEAYGNLGRLRQAGNLTDITTLQDQGKQQQTLGQQGKDMAYGDFMRKQQYPQQQIANFSSTLHGIPAPVNTVQYAQAPGTPQVNTWGNLGSLAGQMYGMNMMRGYAEGGRVEEAEEVRQAGRKGDSVLAHINPIEALILEALGGSGSVNPETGLPEFHFDFDERRREKARNPSQMPPVHYRIKEAMPVGMIEQVTRAIQEKYHPSPPRPQYQIKEPIPVGMIEQVTQAVKNRFDPSAKMPQGLGQDPLVRRAVNSAVRLPDAPPLPIPLASDPYLAPEFHRIVDSAVRIDPRTGKERNPHDYLVEEEERKRGGNAPLSQPFARTWTGFTQGYRPGFDPEQEAFRENSPWQRMAKGGYIEQLIRLCLGQ